MNIFNKIAHTAVSVSYHLNALQLELVDDWGLWQLSAKAIVRLLVPNDQSEEQREARVGVLATSSRDASGRHNAVVHNALHEVIDNPELAGVILRHAWKHMNEIRHAQENEIQLKVVLISTIDAPVVN